MTKKNMINTSNQIDILSERLNGSEHHQITDLRRAELSELRSKKVMIEQPLDIREQRIYKEFVSHLESVDHPLSLFITEFHSIFSRTYTSFIEENKEQIERASKSFKSMVDPTQQTQNYKLNDKQEVISSFYN